MRLAELIAAAMALVAAGGAVAPAAARAEVAAQLPSLAPGEMLLEVRATGMHVSRADRVVLLVPIVARGATPTEARRKMADEARAIVAAAEAGGASAAGVRLLPATSRVGFVGNEALEYMTQMSDPPSPSMTIRTVEIVLPDLAQVEQVRSQIERAVPDARIGDPEYRLADPSAAQSAARAQAIASGRAQAEDFARALGMRVTRILSVVVPPDSDEMMMMVKQMQMQQPTPPEGQVETRESVRIAFALAPAR